MTPKIVEKVQYPNIMCYKYYKLAGQSYRVVSNDVTSAAFN